MDRTERNIHGFCGRGGVVPLHVTAGQATLTYNSRLNLAAAGPLAPDGSFDLRGTLDNSVRVTGRIEGDVARATYVSHHCSYAMELRRE